MARSQQPCGSRPDRLRDAALCPAPDRAGATRPASLSPHDQKYRDLPEEVLAGCKGLLAMGICALPVLLGFVLPASVLAHDALAHVTAGLAPEFWDAALNARGLSRDCCYRLRRGARLRAQADALAVNTGCQHPSRD